MGAYLKDCMFLPKKMNGKVICNNIRSVHLNISTKVSFVIIQPTRKKNNFSIKRNDKLLRFLLEAECLLLSRRPKFKFMYLTRAVKITRLFLFTELAAVNSIVFIRSESL